jgi:hypothetical protein
MKTIVTPTGKTRWCFLTQPSKGQYDDKAYGTYRTQLILSEEDWNAFKTTIKPEYEKAYLEECQRSGTQLKKTETSPFKIGADGEYYIEAKMKGGGKRKDGSEYFLSVGRFDAKGNPINDDTLIGSGCKVKLGIKPYFWNVPAVGGFGMTFEPQAVQVLELAEVGTSEKASSFGFTAEESGYTHGGETFEQTLDQPTNDNTDAETKEEAKPSAADF